MAILKELLMNFIHNTCLEITLSKLLLRKLLLLHLPGIDELSDYSLPEACVTKLRSDAIASLLTDWCWDKMAAFSQTTFSHAFSLMKMFKFRLIFKPASNDLGVYHGWPSTQPGTCTQPCPIVHTAVLPLFTQPCPGRTMSTAVCIYVARLCASCPAV